MNFRKRMYQKKKERKKKERKRGHEITNVMKKRNIEKERKKERNMIY